METVSDLIDSLGGTIVAAKALSAPASTVSAWKSRNSIPSSHWPRIVALTNGSISYEMLGRMKAASMESASPDQSIQAAE